MNPIIFLQKRFGSTQTKIKAIDFEIERLHEEIKYNLEQAKNTSDPDEETYYSQLVVDIQYAVMVKHSTIDALQNTTNF